MNSGLILRFASDHSGAGFRFPNAVALMGVWWCQSTTTTTITTTTIISTYRHFFRTRLQA
jgi:hypothetical protein